MAFPIRTVQSLTVLLGQTNGKLPDSILVDTAGQAGGPTVRLVEPAARAWRALCAEARKSGHTLKATSLFDSFRPYEVQERIFLQRFTTSRVSSTRRWWRGQWWYLKPGYALAAIPGTSNHGWARAIDAGEESDGDTGTESIDDATLAWLVANEERFGFSHEVPSERWHIRYFAGDTPPRAVLEYEASLKPTPPPDPEDDEVRLLVKGDQTAQWWITDGIEARHVQDRAEARHLVFSKLAAWNDGEAFVWPQVFVDRLDKVP